MKLIKKLFLFLLLLLLGFAVFAFGYYFAVTRGVELSPEKLVFTEKTVTVYDNAKESVPTASVFGKQTTPFRKLPQHTIQAFVDTEDKRFFSHGGYDVRRIVRAGLNNLKAGGFKEGASTISQQLIKNTHLSQEKTFKRKLREWKLTRELEKKYSKEEILERYLNTIYFGHSCFGITAASEYYFGKSPTELTLADSAILAGLVKSPNNYSPFANPESCQKRKGVVLNAMLRNGSITTAEKIDAFNAPLPTPSVSKTGSGYLSFVFDELTTLSETQGFTVGGKMQIYTYLDQALQRKVEEIAEGYADSDKTLLVLDGNACGFKAGVSTVGNIRRLPASLLKPLLVYAPAIEENELSPATPILDEKVNYGGYSPENYDGKYRGYVSARESVEQSLNIPAVKVLETLGVRTGAAYLEKLGLPVEKEDLSLALALGGMKNGYDLQALMGGYSTLQKEGKKQIVGFIAAVDVNGKRVYEKPTTAERVFSEETAYLTTDMLKGTAKQGTAKKLRSLPFEIAAKTGTVGTKKGNTDAYTLSYTTQDCVGVWVGNADNSPVECTGGGAPCNLSYQIHQALHALYEREGKSIPSFPPCKNVVRVDLDKTSYYDTHTLSLADDLAPANYRLSELFKKSAIPLNKSTSFTNPSIVSPSLSLKDNEVIITFDKRSPTYYSYKIDRYDYATHTTVYEGDFPNVFTDSKLSPDKNYLYTVTPYFEGRAGTPVPLPVVSTKTGESPSINDEEILSKKWWEY